MDCRPNELHAYEEPVDMKWNSIMFDSLVKIEHSPWLQSNDFTVTISVFLCALYARLRFFCSFIEPLSDLYHLMHSELNEIHFEVCNEITTKQNLKNENNNQQQRNGWVI